MSYVIKERPFDDSVEASIAMLAGGAASHREAAPVFRLAVATQERAYHYSLSDKDADLDASLDRAVEEIITSGDIFRGLYIMAVPTQDGPGCGQAAFPDGRTMEVVAAPVDMDLPDGMLAADVWQVRLIIDMNNPMTHQVLRLAKRLWGKAWEPAPGHGPDCDCGAA